MMKMNFKQTAFAIAMLLFGLTSCSNDNSAQQGIEEEGQQTYIDVILDFPKTSATRATTDPNATEAEAMVKTVDIFICQGPGLAHHPLTIEDFTPVAGTSGEPDHYKATKKIETTTGDKVVYVGINLPADVIKTVNSENDLKTKVQTIERAALANKTDGFPMFSEGVAKTFVAEETDPANQVTLSAKRMAAKITVEKKAELQQSGVKGTLGELEFDVNNFNKRSFLVQGAAPEYKDPNWADGSYDAGDFDTFSKEHTDYTTIVESNAVALNELEARYAAENTSEKSTMQELTRLTVRSTFVPERISSWDNSKITTVDNTETNPKTFYTVTVGEETYCFYDATEANAFAVSNGLAAAVVYDDGHCYWDMFLNLSAAQSTPRWSIIRNQFYRCTIKSVVTPGRNTPDLTDGGDTPDAKTSIEVTIDVENWDTPILDDYELVP